MRCRAVSATVLILGAANGPGGAQARFWDPGFRFWAPFGTPIRNPKGKNESERRTKNKHGGGHCAAAHLDPHGALGHSSVLAEFAGLLYFADIYFADIYSADICSDIFLPLILFPADISFKYQIFANIFISCRYLQISSINIC